MIEIVTVRIGGAEVHTLKYRGVIYVLMKQCCQEVGLCWPNEHRRIKRDPILWGACIKLVTPLSLGQEQLCMRLTHWQGWLFKLNINTVNPDARPIVIALQNEGYQRMYNRWNAQVLQGEIR